MRINRHLMEKIRESMASVLPITAIVFLLSITIAPLDPGTLVLFLFGAILLVGGMGLFTLGVDMSMIPMGEGVGSTLSKSRHLIIPLTVYFLLGVLTTMAEPDLQVLSKQVPAINSTVLVVTVAVGVGLFLVAATVRIRRGVPLRRMLLVLYFAVFALAAAAPGNFIPVSFDSGGVTTGPITVPFIMSLGLGIASTRSDKNSASDSFGLISLCSIGPILCVLLLGIIYKPQEAASHLSVIPSIPTTAQAAQYFIQSFPTYLREVAMALLPVAGLFLVFQLLTRRFKRGQLIRIVTGLLYTYLGLVLFLCGVNVGFMPAGQLIGATIANGVKWLLVPIGMLIGYYIVKAEPAVSVLTKQVEEISNGSISQRAMGLAMSIGVCVSVGLAMIRVLTGLNIFWLLIPGYAISLGLTFLVPSIFTGIAFDSGGVASGPMTATFLLPFAQGACHALGGNMMTDAFGIVAMVAMTPLVTIQVMGLSSIIHHKLARRRLRSRMELVEDMVLYFD
ncbi:MAG: DUF1538 domain-containing protein [Lawsonibacter sp.]|nr:DUF1538 domain-containing protein [Lawsonibacter sp.]MCI9672331.1 DUF1538 domain-containing protein [Lawsonibacter sp.]